MTDRLRAVFCLAGYLSLRTRASLRRSAVSAMPAPMTMRASVALKLPGAMQSIQVPMIVDASNIVRFPCLIARWPTTGRSQPPIFGAGVHVANLSTKDGRLDRLLPCRR
jgi:hypothetical protein